MTTTVFRAVSTSENNIKLSSEKTFLMLYNETNERRMLDNFEAINQLDMSKKRCACVRNHDHHRMGIFLGFNDFLVLIKFEFRVRP